MAPPHSEAECIFPGCTVVVKSIDLDGHLRKHFHFKQHRCICGEKFYSSDQLLAHSHANLGSGQIHYRISETVKDAYMNALLFRMSKDCLESEKVEIQELTQRLYVSVPSSSFTSPPDGRGRPLKRNTPVDNQSGSQDEQLAAKRSRTHQNSEGDAPRKSIQSILRTSAAPSPRRRSSSRSRSPTERRSSSSSARPSGSRGAPPPPCVTLSSTLDSSMSDSDGRTAVVRGNLKNSHSSPNLQQRSWSSAVSSTGPTLSSSLPSVPASSTLSAGHHLSPPTGPPPMPFVDLPVFRVNTDHSEKVDPPAEFVNIPPAPCMLCPKKKKVDGDFESRRVHVADNHMIATSMTRNYRVELAHKMRQAFPNLSFDESVCQACHKTGHPIMSLQGRMNHIRLHHLPKSVYLMCPHPQKSTECKLLTFARLEELNKHMQTDHYFADGYKNLRERFPAAYDAFNKTKASFNSQCAGLMTYYFPVAPSGQATPSRNASPAPSTSTSRSTRTTPKSTPVKLGTVPTSHSTPTTTAATTNVIKKEVETPTTSGTQQQGKSKHLKDPKFEASSPAPNGSHVPEVGSATEVGGQNKAENTSKANLFGYVTAHSSFIPFRSKTAANKAKSRQIWESKARFRKQAKARGRGQGLLHVPGGTWVL